MTFAPAASIVDELSSPIEDAREQIRQLQARIRGMQATTLDEPSLPTHPALAPLFPGGGLKPGASYSVHGSHALLLALLAGPSAGGAWCGVVGEPDLGTEAAAHFGVALDRLVLVPHPGERWFGVTAALVDVLGVVVVHPRAQLAPAEISRLSARLRQRGSTLLALGDWPHAEAVLRISRSGWQGVGSGFGYLSSRRVTVTASSRADGNRMRSVELLLAGPGEQIRSVQPERPAWVQPERVAVAALPPVPLPTASVSARAAASSRSTHASHALVGAAGWSSEEELAG